MLRRGNEPSVVARIERLEGNANEEELRINIPCWMLDEQACSHWVTEANSGCVSLEALSRLRALVDCGLMVVKGDHRECTKTTRGNVASEAKDA